MSKIVDIPNYGKVKSGKVTIASDSTGRLVHQYIGIPFAQPPVGKLRFLPPKRASSWEGILCNEKQSYIPVQDVSRMDIVFKFCPVKRSFNGSNCSEDCLYLNIFVPEVPKAKSLPVMVWLYGGSFQVGPTVFFDGTALAGMNDVIIVVPNYRVNTFGFISLGIDSKSKGNLGLLDQLEALKWVKENIEVFGGDKDNVTIFGQSAGGMSIHMHMLSPLSQGYFNKAISFSGTAATPRIFIKDQSRATKKLLDILNIKETNPKLILEKLQALSTQEIHEADLQLLMARYAWFPTFDNYFFVDSPTNLLSQERFSKVPYMLGFTNSEGGWLMNIGIPSFMDGSSEKLFTSYCTPLLKWFDKSIDPRKALPLLAKTYNESTPSDDKLYYSKGIAGVMKDTTFISGLNPAAEKHSESGCPTYVYNLTHKPRYNHEDAYGPRDGRKPDFVHCDHGDDVFFIWGVPFLPDNISDGFRFSEEEKNLSKQMMTYITNFAKTGNPNTGAPVDLTWPAYSKMSPQHIVLDTPLSTGCNLGLESLFLYKKVLPKL